MLIVVKDDNSGLHVVFYVMSLVHEIQLAKFKHDSFN